MGLLLSESDKLMILLMAFALFVLTFVLTACLVVQRCYLFKRFVKPKINQKEAALSVVYPPIANPESQHFHLSIMPVYGAQQSVTQSLTSTPVKHRNADGANPYENLTQLAEKTRIRYSSLKPDNLKALPLFPKVRANIRYVPIGKSHFRLCITIGQVYDLKLKEYLIEPSCYVVVYLAGYKDNRKSLGISCKASQEQEIFRTETIKKSLSPIFVNSHVTTDKLPKCLLKEGCVILRAMDEERNANDVCLGEISIPLKKVALLDCSSSRSSKSSKCDESNAETTPAASTASSSSDVDPDTATNVEPIVDRRSHSLDSAGVPAIFVTEEKSCTEMNTYTLFSLKEEKGELTASFCYLPTSKRINITIGKANIRRQDLLESHNGNSPLHQAFYVRILMFSNGKLIKKKKTSLSASMCWGQETISFDLNDEPYNLVSFMLVLSSKMQNSNTPSSPETPTQSPDKDNKQQQQQKQKQPPTRSNSTWSQTNSSSHKETHIGHFVLGRDAWLEEVLKKPRQSEMKIYKLY